MEFPKGGDTEKMLAKFAGAHPEYADLSPDEIRQAAELVNAHHAVSSEETLRDALNARLSVRESEGKVPVKNDFDEVIGMASPGQGREMYKKDKGERDLK